MSCYVRKITNHLRTVRRKFGRAECRFQPSIVPELCNTPKKIWNLFRNGKGAGCSQCLLQGQEEVGRGEGNLVGKLYRWDNNTSGIWEKPGKNERKIVKRRKFAS